MRDPKCSHHRDQTQGIIQGQAFDAHQGLALRNGYLEKTNARLHTTYMEFVVFLLGLAVGSFLNVLIDRLPAGKNVITGRSRCDHCGKILGWFELIPLLSFALQGGSCRRCRKRLSWQYPIVELVTGIGFVFLFQSQAFQDQSLALMGHQSLALIGQLLIFASLLVIFVTDLKTQIIPDSMVVLGIVGVLLQSQAFQDQSLALWLRQSMALWLSAIGASGFFLLLWLVTRRRGMGLGDVKLAFLMGLLLGFPNIIVACYLAFLTGAIAGVILILLRVKKLKGRIAFGPFLVIGTVIAFSYGERLVTWWMRLL